MQIFSFPRPLKRRAFWMSWGVISAGWLLYVAATAYDVVALKGRDASTLEREMWSGWVGASDSKNSFAAQVEAKSRYCMAGTLKTESVAAYSDALPIDRPYDDAIARDLADFEREAIRTGAIKRPRAADPFDVEMAAEARSRAEHKNDRYEKITCVPTSVYHDLLVKVGVFALIPIIFIFAATGLTFLAYQYVIAIRWPMDTKVSMRMMLISFALFGVNLVLRAQLATLSEQIFGELGFTLFDDRWILALSCVFAVWSVYAFAVASVADKNRANLS